MDTNLDTGLIQLERREGGVVEAHIGMLKSHHTYRAEIPITHSLGWSNNPMCVFTCASAVIRECIQLSQGNYGSFYTIVLLSF